METPIRGEQVSYPQQVASFLGSGINGNLLVCGSMEPSQPASVASFLGSGINGNTSPTDAGYLLPNRSRFLSRKWN